MSTIATYLLKSLAPSFARPSVSACHWIAALTLTLLLSFAPCAPGFAAQTRDTFDHLTTGFELLGQHRDLPCEACHANAVFKGTPRECGACHGVGTTIRATSKTANHILSSDRCDSCHTPVAWKPAVNFDHAEARGSCSTCHNGVQAQGKPATHVQTDLECDVCHSTISWSMITFKHDGITGNCASCHDGVHATGMPATHIPTNNAPCESCHSPTNFTTWSGATMNHSAVTTIPCATCHEAGKSFAGVTIVTRPPAPHPTSGDCSLCHNSTTSFTADAPRPANHIPTTAPCAQCHTSAGNYTVYSVTGTHIGVTDCLSCHGPSVANTFANITITSTSTNHIPIGSLDCNGSGCHTTTNVNTGGFNIGPANLANPTLTTAGHTTVAAAVPACQTCHETAPYQGMIASSASAAGDSRPSAFDKGHPTSGDCSGCHTTTPTFTTNISNTAKPANHIPTNAPCAQCHTTAGNYALYSVTGTHQGVTTCLSCHGPSVATTFANITITSTSATHIPIGTLDCNGSGCHTTTNLNTGGFNIGAANLTSPTLSIAGHTTVAAAVPACQTCHETSPYQGMIASSASAWGDSRPTAFDKVHPTSGDCNGCHTTTPTFALDVTAGKPANHIPTNAPCAQCHTTAGNYALYSVTGTHQGVTTCSSCHGPSVATTFANITITSTSATHIPIGTLDCNGSGCHTTTNLNTGGFNIGAANLTNPTLSIAGHTTVAAAVPACQTCHETSPYQGMIASSASAWGDSRPTAFDKVHPTAGDCSGCHTTTPTFALDVTAGKPANHIPTSAPCAQCHTTPGNYAAYSVTATHQGVTTCANCHGPAVAGTFANVTITTTPGNHIPTGTLDCNGGGCHTATSVSPGGFNIGTANINSPTLSATGHTTVAAAVGTCQTCHETAAYLGMVASSAGAAGDSRPPTALDAAHPTSGDCGGCHLTTPTFAGNVVAGTKPANHIPTNAACTQCHTSPGNFAVYSVTGTHQGVTNCLSCHGPSVASTFANITITTTSATHIPIGSLDCNGSGCHTTTNVNPGGFTIGTANTASPTLNIAGHTTVAAAVPACQTCHETAPYQGMLASSASAWADSRPSAFDKNHPTAGDCTGCHTTTPTFASDITNAAKPANHIPTSAPCTQCHTTPNNYAVYSVTGTHQGVTNCLSCHGPSVASTFANVTITTTSANHIPIGSLDCSGSGCHTPANVNPGGFQIGAANISSPTLNVAGHTTVAAAVAACQTCHETAPYQGMIASSATTAGDSRPTAFDKAHPTAGDCSGCHTTTPTFATDQTGSATKPANHIPTNAPCAQCHTTAGNYAVYSVTGTHQGVTGCVSCHAPGVAGTFANVTIVSTSASHIPIGSLDCNGSGCHAATNVNPGGFQIGAANISNPTLSVTGHTTVAAAVAACQTCHETAAYQGMIASSATAAGDSRPTALDSAHPTAGDCSGCHTTTPTFATDQTGSAKPANHIPTTAPCAQCHTTAGNYAVYSVTGTHQGVTGCLSCHAPAVAGTFANVAIVSTSASHIPIGSLDCNGSGCHTTANVSSGGFHIGAANISAPTLTTTGHATVATAVAACQTCHESAAYQGMVASTATTAGDSRPTAFDKSHPTTGDCGSCHTTTPTFISNVTAGSKPANHIPTNAACTQCHTTPGNFAAYVMGTQGHTGITNNCAQCHADGLSFANMAPPTLVEPPTGPTGHIPVGTIACEQCHSVTNFTTFSGTVMKHAAVRANACDSCHEYGMTWQTNTGVKLWVRPSPNHHAGQDCGGSGCHTSRDKHAVRPAAAVARGANTVTTSTGASATGATAAASAASVGRTRLPARGNILTTGAPTAPVAAAQKPADHIPTTSSCMSCHTTVAWLPVRTVDHTQVIGTCFSCHNGRLATGKPARHLPSSNACEACHTTNAWMPARFDHTTVTPHTCTTCHNAVMAIGMPRNHVPTSQQCDTCHGTLAWTPAKLDHTTLLSNCQSCHNNTNAVGKPTAHMVLQLDCATCHKYPDWSVITFRHTSAAYPGAHRAALTCISCHTTNTDKVPYPFAAAAGSCAGCHAKDFNPKAHPRTTRGALYTVTDLSNCSGACHIYNEQSTRDGDTIAKRLPGPYHRASDAAFKH
jgi:hypothetical protein